MIWNKKNKKLLLVLVILNIATLIVFFVSPKNSFNDINRTKFALDTARVSTIHLLKGDKNFSIYKNKKTWYDSHKKLTNQEKVQYLLAVFSQNKTKRKLTGQDGEKIYQKYRGNEVKIIVDDLQPLYVICNDRHTKVYWTLDHKEYYSIGIEGYTANICSAFNTDSLYWKNNYIFVQHFRYLSEIEYINNSTSKKDYHITLNDGKIKTDFKAKKNDEEMSGWLRAVSGLEFVDYILKGNVYVYDSLLKTDIPLSLFEQKKLLKQDGNMLKIYPRIKGDDFHIVEYGDDNVIGRIHKSSFKILDTFKGWAMANK